MFSVVRFSGIVLMKLLITLTLVVISLSAHSQISDQDIVNATIGKSYPRVHSVLDSLGIWYALHIDNDNEKSQRGVPDRKKIFSISDGKGVVKVWAFVLDTSGNIVDEIVINYRHDSRQQVEDSRKLKGFADFHVGLYSSDFVFKKRK